MKHSSHIFRLLLFASIISGHQTVSAQNTDTAFAAVKKNLKISFPSLGSVKPRSTNEIESSNWLIGCETLDRDFTNYDEYKEYIVPLGIKRLRMQAGWDKTEKVKGIYDWAWLDHIIDDAAGRGLQPWLQTSYGNHNYKGGGGANLGAGMPDSKEALEAWDKWVSALVTRYKDKVKDWEIWNEPNFGDNEINTPEKTAELNSRTISIIKRIQPDARVSGLSMGHISLPYAESFFKILQAKGKLSMFHDITYHDYVYNPDANYDKVEALRTILHKYAPGMPLRQGENGAPSSGGSGRGALWDYNWSELTQAKWDTRRMLGNLGHDIECSIFGLIEMAYTSGPINKLNYKGIIQSDSTKKAIRPKVAYYALQHVTSIFDNSLERIKGLHFTHNRPLLSTTKEPLFVQTTDRSLSVFGYSHKKTGRSIYTIWADDYIPTDNNTLRNMDFSFSHASFEQPVLVDIITGIVYEIPADRWSKSGNVFSFTGIPVYDAPMLIADRSLIKIQ